jgi:asparagine synthase (glutamine-hydrolysing)
MCGINGTFAYSDTARPVDHTELIRTRDHMAARGPDGSGIWLSEDGRLGFGHRRLSIIDLSEAGAQPMSNAEGTLVVTFNGEIYNYRELRHKLESKGFVFQSSSDTEVLLHLYASKGESMVRELRGMFAFAIWDTLRRELFLARDPYGIKPLYYADDGGTLRFASQVKALLAGQTISRDPEPAGVVGFHLWGNVPEPFTLYSAIRAVPAGCTVRVTSSGPTAPQRFHSIAETYAESERAGSPTTPFREVARAAILDSVRHHLIADVPVGAFLSAGVDSGALVGLMRDAGQNDIQTVTLSFGEFRGRADDEAPLAALVARHYGAQHTERVVTEAEFVADLPLILRAMDQPSVDGINTWFVSKAARELGLKVAISGLGGDELFGGYPSFRDTPRWVASMRPFARLPALGRTARRLSAPFTRLLSLNPKLAGMLELGGTYEGAYLLRRGVFMPWELDSVLDRDMVRTDLARLPALAPATATLDPRPERPFSLVATLESALYMRNQLLRDTDWTSMAHALEVRTPLVDAVLLEQLAPHLAARSRIPGKMELALAPSKPLPEAIVKRRKTGFTVPIKTWLRRSLAARQGDGVPPVALCGGVWSRRWAYEVAELAR